MNFNYERGPWYEETGPNAKYVRENILKKIKNFEITEKELYIILLKNIPDTKTDFGSWRGYATFGLEEKIFNQIKKDIKMLSEKKIKRAYKILNDKFCPIIIHKLYEPGGFMAKKISKKTTVGKKIKN